MASASSDCLSKSPHTIVECATSCGTNQGRAPGGVELLLAQTCLAWTVVLMCGHHQELGTSEAQGQQIMYSASLTAECLPKSIGVAAEPLALGPRTLQRARPDLPAIHTCKSGQPFCSLTSDLCCTLLPSSGYSKSWSCADANKHKLMCGNAICDCMRCMHPAKAVLRMHAEKWPHRCDSWIQSTWWSSILPGRLVQQSASGRSSCPGPPLDRHGQRRQHA